MCTFTAPLMLGEVRPGSVWRLRIGTYHLQKSPVPHAGAISLRQGLWLVALLPSSSPSQAQMPTLFPLPPGPLVLDLFLPGSTGLAPAPQQTWLCSAPCPCLAFCGRGERSLPREEGTMVSFRAPAGLQTTLSSEVLICSYHPPTGPGIGTSEERRGTEVTSTPLSGLALGPCSKQGEGDGGYKWPGRPERALGRPPSQAKLHAFTG